jgi:hypothetical protein
MKADTLEFFESIVNVLHSTVYHLQTESAELSVQAWQHEQQLGAKPAAFNSVFIAYIFFYSFSNNTQ